MDKTGAKPTKSSHPPQHNLPPPPNHSMGGHSPPWKCSRSGGLVVFPGIGAQYIHFNYVSIFRASSRVRDMEKKREVRKAHAAARKLANKYKKRGNKSSASSNSSPTNSGTNSANDDSSQETKYIFMVFFLGLKWHLKFIINFVISNEHLYEKYSFADKHKDKD